MGDEFYEMFGEKLLLFLFLELKCVEIEKFVCLIDIVRSIKEFVKE